jgi:hypothetical protein
MDPLLVHDVLEDGDDMLVGLIMGLIGGHIVGSVYGCPRVGLMGAGSLFVWTRCCCSCTRSAYLYTHLPMHTPPIAYRMRLQDMYLGRREAEDLLAAAGQQHGSSGDEDGNGGGGDSSDGDTVAWGAEQQEQEQEEQHAANGGHGEGGDEGPPLDRAVPADDPVVRRLLRGGSASSWELRSEWTDASEAELEGWELPARRRHGAAGGGGGGGVRAARGLASTPFAAHGRHQHHQHHQQQRQQGAVVAAEPAGPDGDDGPAAAPAAAPPPCPTASPADAGTSTTHPQASLSAAAALDSPFTATATAAAAAAAAATVGPAGHAPKQQQHGRLHAQSCPAPGAGAPGGRHHSLLPREGQLQLLGHLLLPPSPAAPSRATSTGYGTVFGPDTSSWLRRVDAAALGRGRDPHEVEVGVPPACYCTAAAAVPLAACCATRLCV